MKQVLYIISVISSFFWRGEGSKPAKVIAPEPALDINDPEVAYEAAPESAFEGTKVTRGKLVSDGKGHKWWVSRQGTRLRVMVNKFGQMRLKGKPKSPWFGPRNFGHTKAS